MRYVEFDEVVRIIYFENGEKIVIPICDVERDERESATRLKQFLDEDMKGKQDAMKAIGATDVRHHVRNHYRRVYSGLEEFRTVKGI